VPLTDFQATLAKCLSANRTEDNYLAGGAALHLAPNGRRYSNDLDYFCDSEQRVAEAFERDRQALVENGYVVHVEISQPGYIRAQVKRNENSTKVEWSHDSAWRFLPVVHDERVGYMLHPIDLAVNKLLALVGRDEPRDFLDVLYVHRAVLALGALCWAAAGKDPGFTPQGVLELLKRRGQYRAEDFNRLRLVSPVDLSALKREWLLALDDAASFLAGRPPEDVGCLYYSKSKAAFVVPNAEPDDDIVAHFGRPGGVLPKVLGASLR
jgi:hypothetical protein